MYILQNALKNISRNKGRNILLGIIILAIIATSSIALIINNTAGGIIDNYKQRFGSEVTLSPDMSKIQPVTRSDGQGWSTSLIQAPESPTPEQYIAFGESKYIKEVQYTATIGVYDSDEIDFIDEDKGGGGRMMAMSRVRVGENGNVEIESEDESENEDSTVDNRQYFANIMGYEGILPEEFKEGMRQLADGRLPEKDGECIISRDFLEKNELEIGSTINFTATIRERGSAVMPGEEDTAESRDINYTLTIVGYYDDLTDEYANEYMQNAYFNRRNEIITTFGTVVEQLSEGFDGMNVSAIYYLANPDDLDAFAAEIYSKGLDEAWSVSTDENSYNTIVKPVEGLKGITLVFLAVVLILGAIILILLSSIAIRERKYEIGVLRAMGMKKNKVAAGLLSEMIIITVLCLVLGLGTGIAAAQPVSDMLLENQLAQIEEQGGGGNMGFTISGGGSTSMRTSSIGGMRIGGGGFNFSASPAEALKEMDVSLNILTIIEIVLVSLGLAIAASIVGITHVTRYEPIKILSDRT